MNAPPFPINPDVGEWFGNWVWNGARWVASPTTGLRILIQIFTQSGPYMPSPGLVTCMVECWGGGGMGGAASGDAMTVDGGGGGGSGGYSRSSIPAALVRGGILVTIGRGGDETMSPAGSPYDYAANGEPTAFGALCVANGGGGGGGNAAAGQIWGYPGLGADPGIGDVALPGQPGQPGTSQGGTMVAVNAIGGSGGAIIGGGAQAQMLGPGQVGPGRSATGPAGGGSGAVQNTVDGSAPGGVGGPGLCVVTEYVVGDRDQPLTEWRPPLDVNVNLQPPRPPHSWPQPPWPGGPWPPGAWWPPGWGPGQPWPPSWGPQPRGAIEGREFEAGQPYDQGINPETGQPWEDDR